LEKIEDERQQVLVKARQEADQQLQELQDEIRRLRMALSRAGQPLEAVQAVEEELEPLQELIEQPVEHLLPQLPGTVEQRALRVGDKVYLRTLKAQGVLTSLSGEEAEVQVGVLRVRARLAELDLASATPVLPARPTPSELRKTGAKPATHATKVELPASPGMELDLRGQRAEEALDALDRYLDASYLAGLPFVRIIHGKGTGKLRQSVREALSHHPHVSSYESGGDKEGGEGVTVARLRTG
jgi:DNA mismatch repair protein MutS2